MASLEELKRNLKSVSDQEHLDAVRALWQMKAQRDNVVPLLKNRLENDL